MQEVFAPLPPAPGSAPSPGFPDVPRTSSDVRRRHAASLGVAPGLVATRALVAGVGVGVAPGPPKSEPGREMMTPTPTRTASAATLAIARLKAFILGNLHGTRSRS